MTDLKPEGKIKTPADKATGDATNIDSAVALSQQCWKRDKCDPATRTPAESQALHDLGQRVIDDAFAEFKHNPPPEAWQYDAKGNLLEAGDRVKATYDKNGQLQKAQIDDKTYEKVGNDVVESFQGKDGKPYSYKMEGIQNFTLKTVDGEFHGAYKSVDLEAKTANGSGTGDLAKIWESKEHSDFVTDYWEKENKREQENRKKNEKP